MHGPDPSEPPSAHPSHSGRPVDAHVHIHPVFPLELFLDSANRNLARHGSRGMLLLTEIAGASAFDRLQTAKVKGWRIEPTGEDASIQAVPEAGEPIVIVRGRQIVTAERLELLALGAADNFADGQPLAEAVRSVSEAGGIPVLPWGFGKWIGRRGALVRDFVQDTASFPTLMLGDNGGRPAGLPPPILLTHGRSRGRLILPGSDPLPLRAEATKAGRFGFLADLPARTDRPFGALRAWLLAQRRSPPAFGRAERADVFVRRQIALRLGR